MVAFSIVVFSQALNYLLVFFFNKGKSIDFILSTVSLIEQVFIEALQWEKY